jgi:hypothetical protein
MILGLKSQFIFDGTFSEELLVFAFEFSTVVLLLEASLLLDVSLSLVVSLEFADAPWTEENVGLVVELLTSPQDNNKVKVRK